MLQAENPNDTETDSLDMAEPDPDSHNGILKRLSQEELRNITDTRPPEEFASERAVEATAEPDTSGPERV